MNRYSIKELNEFKELIELKLEQALEEYQLLSEEISNKNNGTDDTSWSHKMDDGKDTLSKEEANILGHKKKKFIESLRRALVRIENKTYGICIASGNLIPKERLLAVPQATLCIEEKRKE